MVKPVLRVINGTVTACKVHRASLCGLPTLPRADSYCTRCFHLLSSTATIIPNHMSGCLPSTCTSPTSPTPGHLLFSSSKSPEIQPFRLLTVASLSPVNPLLNRQNSAGCGFGGTSSGVSFALRQKSPAVIGTPADVFLQSTKKKATLPEKMPKRQHSEEQETAEIRAEIGSPSADSSSTRRVPFKFFMKTEEKVAANVAAPSGSVEIPSTTLGNIQRILDSQDVRSRTLETPVTIKVDTSYDVWRMNKLCNRRWLQTDAGRTLAAGNQPHGIEFTMATYNVLAQNLLFDNSYLYTHVKNEYLSWSYRQRNLLAEITMYQPDIMCCQEIQEQHYTEFFYPEMQKLGYQGAFKKRTRSMSDGCATFFKTSVFECDAIVPIEYLKSDCPVLDRDNVALLLLLRPKSFHGDDAPKLCVANTHLLFNPRRGDVKLAQLMMLFAEIDQLAFHPDAKNPSKSRYHPVLFCGDLNMEPFSRLYEFISQGSLTIDGLNIRKLSGQEHSSSRAGDRMLPRKFLDKNVGITDQSQFVSVCTHRTDVDSKSSASDEEDEKTKNGAETSMKPPSYTLGSGTVSHSFRLKSVYPHMISDGRPSKQRGIREVTTSHDRANCTVDYIFYTGGRPRRTVSDENLLSGDATVDVSSLKRSASVDTLPSGKDFSGKDRYSGNGENAEPLQLLSQLELISESDMLRIGKLPNELISSDHLILAAKFLLKC